MKILYTTNFLSPYRVDFFNELGKHHDLTVWASKNVTENRDDKWFNNSYQNFEVICVDGRLNHKSKLVKTIASYDLAIIGVYTEKTAMLAMLYSKFKNIPIALEIDGGIKSSGKGAKEKLKKFLLSIPKWYFSPSTSADDYLKFYGAKQEEIYRYPFTSSFASEFLEKPPSLAEKSELRKELGMTEKKIVVSVGQFIYRKGNDVLMKAAHILNDPSIGFYIIGGKPTEEYLVLKEKLGLDNLHFIDFKVKSELAKWYKAADIFVLPTREDIWGLVINEAMQFGLPVVTTDRCVAGLELVKDNENGFIVPVDDSSSLADKMHVILNNNELRSKMAEESLRKISGHTIENMVICHLDIIAKIVFKKCCSSKIYRLLHK